MVFFFPLVASFVFFVAEMGGDGIQERTRTGYGHGTRIWKRKWGTTLFGSSISPCVFSSFRLVALLAWCMPLSFILFYSYFSSLLGKKRRAKVAGGGGLGLGGLARKGELGEGRRGGKINLRR